MKTEKLNLRGKMPFPLKNMQTVETLKGLRVGMHIFLSDLKKRKQTNYTIPARVWEESLPLGNGSLGAMIFGNPTSERIALNHDTLWSGHPCQHERPGAAESIRRTADLTMERRYVEAMQEAEQNALCQWTELYMPAGDLWIEFPEAAYSDYSRSLDLTRAVAATSFLSNDAFCFREALLIQ